MLRIPVDAQRLPQPVPYQDSRPVDTRPHRLSYTVPQYPNEKFGDFVPRSGNQEGSGVLGWTYKCKGWESDPNAYVYIIFQRGAKDFELACKAFGFEDWLTNPDFNTADARDRHKQEIYARVQAWAINKDKFEIVKLLAPAGVPCAPVLSTKEIMDDRACTTEIPSSKSTKAARLANSLP